MKKEIDDWLEEGKISTCDEMWRAFRKEEVSNLPRHAQRRVKAVLLRTSRGHIRYGRLAGLPPGVPPPEEVCRGLDEESQAARVYDMLPYRCEEQVRAEEQKRGRWRLVVKFLLPQQQHQSLLHWINSWATAHYGFDAMKNALMLTTQDRRMGDSLKAMDKVN